jgi:hypothetical protein
MTDLIEQYIGWSAFSLFILIPTAIIALHINKYFDGKK